MKQMARHYHASMSDPCAHTVEEPRWTSVDYLVAVCAGIVVAVAVALFAFLVLVWA